MNKKLVLSLGAGILMALLVSWFVYANYFSLGARLDRYVQAYVDQGLFSGSVLVAKDGKILLCKGYGMANYELDVPNRPDTKFRLASVTKQFTAMAIMQLQEQGLLKVTDPISKYIPDYPNGDKITIRHLLTHTAGIPNFTSFPDLKKIKLEPHTPEQMVALFKDKPLEFTPGEKHNYSNSGYVLLGYLIEKITGKKYETVLKENIFEPLGMKNTGYDHHEVILKNRASGYEIHAGDLINSDYIDMSVSFSAGGLYSTVEDLYLWDRALYTEKLVTKKSWNEIVTPCNKDDDYGYGWCTRKRVNRPCVAHAGGTWGFTTEILRFTNDDVSVIALSNNSSPRVGVITNGLAAIIFGEQYDWPKKNVVVTVNPAIYNQYAGTYKLKNGSVMLVTREDNCLIMQLTEKKKEQLYPKSETEFFLKTADAEISFVKDDNGKVVRLIAHEDGVDYPAEKIS